MDCREVCVGNIGKGVRDGERRQLGVSRHTHTHTHTHTCLLRAQVQGRISHSSPTNFTASTVYVWEETLAMLCEPVIRVCVCARVRYGHAQLCAGLARGCLIGRLQVITCLSILLNCQIISSVTAAIVIVLSPLCSGHFYSEHFKKIHRLRLLSSRSTVSAEWTYFNSYIHTRVCIQFFFIQGAFLEIRARAGGEFLFLCFCSAQSASATSTGRGRGYSWP